MHLYTHEHIIYTKTEHFLFSKDLKNTYLIF